MSCPPAEFLRGPFLSAARDSLAAGGMLVFNCVSRSKPALAAALASLQAHFAQVCQGLARRPLEPPRRVHTYFGSAIWWS